ncbi:hypothetical protein GFPCMMHI_01107 [Ensifer adhaerens]|nr:hypothetical protein [Ensifer adhaerens]
MASKLPFLLTSLFVTSLLSGYCEDARAAEPSDSFNKYILEAVQQLAHDYPSEGYDISKAYTHNIPYGSGVIKASEPPLTMCVAATAEIMITAINLYVKETGDKTPYTYLPPETWNRMRPTDIRSHIWVDPHLDAYGTADALVTFGIGKRVKFSELTPGSFVNINRTNKSGHSVTFLGFLDAQGNELPSYSDKVAGFKYFSSQGKGHNGDAGFAYRYAFFAKPNSTPVCPTLPPSKHRDCNIIWSTGQKMLNTGYVMMPSKWDAATRDKNFKAILAGFYKQNRSRGPDFLGLSKNLTETQFKDAILKTDTMQINPVFLNNMTTDD